MEFCYDSLSGLRHSLNDQGRHYQWCHVGITSVIMWWEGHFISMVLFPNTHYPSPITRKTSNKFKLKDSSQKTSKAVCLKTVKVMKNTERLRNSHGPGDTKETDQLSAIWNPRWDLGIEKGPLMEKNGWTLNNIWNVDNGQNHCPCNHSNKLFVFIRTV